MTITSQYAATCTRCHQPIAPGEQIEWKRGQGSRHLTCQAQPIPEPTGDLKKVVEHLRAQRDKNRMNDFQSSLLRQFERNGSLSPKQIQAILRKLDAPGRQPVPDVPSGRYAVTVGGDVRLVHVWVIEPEKSRSGERVQRLYEIQHVKDRGVMIKGADELAIVSEIAKNPQRAAREFGHRTGHCSRCGSGLDSNLSRVLGIGPVCLIHYAGREDAKPIRQAGRDALRDAGIDPDDVNDDLSAVDRSKLL